MLHFLRNPCFALFALTALLGLSSCVDDTEPNPRATISFNPTAARKTVAPGDSIKEPVIAVNAADNIRSFTIQKAGASQPYLHLPELNQRNYQTVLLDKIDSAAAEGELHVYNFTAVTEKGEITTRSYIVEVSRTVTFTNISLGNQNSTSTGSFFAAASGRVFGKTTPDSNAVLIDMVYYHSAQSGSPLFANGATLAAPADPTAQTAFTEITAWPVRNQTEFRQLGNTLALFNDATTSAKIRAAFGTSPGSNSLTNLTTGTVFGFKTENGKYGIARVTLLTTPNVITNIGAIRLDVRVER